MSPTKQPTKNAQIRALYLAERATEQQRRPSVSAGGLEALMEAAPGEGPDTPVSSEGTGDVVIADAAGPSFGKEGQPKGESPEARIEAAAQTEAAPESGELDESLMLDAYWANYGDASTRALLRSQPPDGSALEVIIGPDERQPVDNTREYPWRCICSLIIRAGDGSSWIGTGWLVGPRTVVTAGHCVYIHDRGGWASRIEVIPGRKGTERPYGSCVATSFRSVMGWTRDKDRNYDYGAILLPPTFRLGDTVGWFGYTVRSDSVLQGSQANISGYPGDKPPGTQWFEANSIAELSSNVITYMIDTAGGQSGAPLWITAADGSRYGVGVHSNGQITGNSATRINQPVFDNISLWKSQAP